MRVSGWGCFFCFPPPPWAGPGLDASGAPLTGPSLDLLDPLAVSSCGPRTYPVFPWWLFLSARPPSLPLDAPPPFLIFFWKASRLSEISFCSAAVPCPY